MKDFIVGSLAGATVAACLVGLLICLGAVTEHIFGVVCR